jgi:hypothetical protein
MLKPSWSMNILPKYVWICVRNDPVNRSGRTARRRQAFWNIFILPYSPGGSTVSGCSSLDHSSQCFASSIMSCCSLLKAGSSESPQIDCQTDSVINADTSACMDGGFMFLVPLRMYATSSPFSIPFFSLETEICGLRCKILRKRLVTNRSLCSSKSPRRVKLYTPYVME